MCACLPLHHVHAELFHRLQDSCTGAVYVAVSGSVHTFRQRGIAEKAKELWDCDGLKMSRDTAMPESTDTRTCCSNAPNVARAAGRSNNVCSESSSSLQGCRCEGRLRANNATMQQCRIATSCHPRSLHTNVRSVRLLGGSLFATSLQKSGDKKQEANLLASRTTPRVRGTHQPLKTASGEDG